MNRALDRLAVVSLLAFAVVALALGYWNLLRGPDILSRDDNPRLVDRERRLARGAIYDRDGEILAQSVAGLDGVYARTYPHSQAAAAVGYYSLRYGVGGVEAAYDATLRGAAQYSAWDALLHRPHVGGDVRLTLDLDVQAAVAEALGAHTGAAILVEADTGDMLALVSQPGFDPNTLDDNWDALMADTGAPLLNRATQGRYQPGAALETVILAAALSEDDLPDIDPARAAEPFALNLNGKTLTLTCARAPQAPPADLFDAFAYACPAPFADWGRRLGVDALGRAFEAFGLLAPPRLFPDADQSLEVTPAPPQTDPVAMSLGQGGLTVSPAQMVRVAAAVASGGALPTLRLVSDTRAPGDAVWQPERAGATPTRAIPVSVALTLQTAMRRAMGESPDMAGHIGLALSGPEGGTLAWFLGFARSEDGAPLAVAVVIEDTTDLALVARIGELALRAAQK